MTAAESAEQAVYLAQYSRHKFAPLLALLDGKLEPAKTQRLSEILVGREIALARAKDDARSTGLTVEQFCASETAKINRQISEEVGADVAAQVEAYIATLPQRLLLAAIDQILVYRHEGLSVPQIERLCALIHQSEVTLPGPHPRLAEWDGYVARQAEAFQRVKAEGVTFLSPIQADVVGRELELQIARLKMQRYMVRTDSDRR